MFRALVVAMFIASPVLAESRDEYKLRRTLDSLQGDWGVKSLTVAGKPAAGGGRYSIRDDVFVKGSEPEESARMLFDLSGSVPKVEFTDRHGVTMLGIMQKTPKGIVMCLVEAGNEPPKDFKSTAQNNAILIELTPARP